MRLIDADALIQKRNHAKAYAPDMYVIGQGYVMDAPTIDAVPAVRCKDCRFLGDENIGLHDCDHFRGPMRVELDDFCSYGERKCD